MKRHILLIAVLSAASWVQAQSAATYTATNIGVLPGYETCQANSMDAAGDVVGFCATNDLGSQHAFLYHAGKMIDIGALYNPALFTCALYTNIRGEVILAKSGAFQYPVPSFISSNEQPVLYRNGRFTPLTFPHGGAGSVAGLNDLGQIAGNYTVDGVLYAYIIEPNGTLITLPNYAGGAISVQGITELGLVYGSVQVAPPQTNAQLVAEYAAALYNYVLTDPYTGVSTQGSGTYFMNEFQNEFPALAVNVSDAVVT
jgi:probable HAF family extracellular repeat protein